ncbi:hypothetical protein [Mycoplasmopsis cricetuli]|uniref:hypothetical protein n=1 Tax=Mycoplasmopsis cricetuli TaxID=171283 RepID=UPI0012EB1977|nr:hypothetical protein [Mycoplasmopsis cricetuli]
MIISTFLLLISIIFLIVLNFNFLNWVIEEKKWISDQIQNDSISAEKNVSQIIQENSNSLHLLKIFQVLDFLIISLFIAAIILNLISLYGLFTEKFNGYKLLKYSLLNISLALTLLFFLISLQPSEVTLSVTKEITIPNTNEIITVNETKSSDKISYLFAWLTLLFNVVTFILIIISRTKYGYLVKDVILKRKFRQLNKT